MRQDHGREDMIVDVKEWESVSLPLLKRHLKDHIPRYMHEGILEYVVMGRPTGSFLHAVFCNDLASAACRADQVNRLALSMYGAMLNFYLPSPCYGSSEKVTAWQRLSGLTGHRRANDLVTSMNAVYPEEQYRTWTGKAMFQYLLDVGETNPYVACLILDHFGKTISEED